MKTNRIIQLLVALLAISLVTTAVAPAVHAQSIVEGNHVLIKEGEVYNDDLYAFGNTVEVNGVIKGDLVAFGSDVKIGPTGIIEGDLIAGAQSIFVQGKVLDDARLAAYAITLGKTADFADDITAAAYSYEAKAGSVVKGGLFFAGAQAVLDGDVADTVRATVSALSINGTLGKDVYLEMGSSGENEPNFDPSQFVPDLPDTPKVARGLEISSGAKIAGNLEYTSSREYSLPAGVVAGIVTPKEPAVSDQPAAKPQPTQGQILLNWFLSNLRNLISLLLVGILLAWLAPAMLRKSAQLLQEKPLPSFGWGMISFFVFLFIVILLSGAAILLAIIFGAVTLGDLVGPILGVGFLGVSGLTTGFSLAVSFVSKIVVGWLIGHLLLVKVKPEWAEQRYWPVITGVILFAILAAIPVLGWVITAIVIIFGMGALWLSAAAALSRPSPVSV